MTNCIVELTDGIFKQYILESKKAVLVDFWAEWCNPCKILAPILEDIAKEYEHKLIVTKINIDKNPNTAPKYSIRGIPALLLFKNSELVGTKVGALSKVQLKDFLNLYLK
ncbi:thioredoxin [Buchnera aphidicola str. Bp (Baizongia pistaciae)]|uniref:Thioredoxin n=1 Tax=Buchnera aphidicola subsp. Baizongia pistaciae (strain Bp) TaxID=224915 RepID=THIO_BUCBP|nr:thioredoxin TrxA [Buchnera aphidicola]P59527.1 RecName: Full=Thioredoxin; Short=Trx [Buchnera aphidicola str. Bp (Baizongia pistaciae)]AAO27238.1 thioredoxin [Buchnera aphidicola str. Bp (Baizongia pistaciae)]